MGRRLMDPIMFLALVWGRSEGWVDLPSKVNGHWTPWSARWPDDLEVIDERIRTSVRDGEDVYFSVAMFNEEGRRIEDTLSTRWLWADLDETSPMVCVELGLEPTIAWASSPGRYQALWQMETSLGPRLVEQLNRALTYAVDADKGGWDLTQVLRIPGSRNFKYRGGPEVRVVHRQGPSYAPQVVYRRLKELGPVGTHMAGQEAASVKKKVGKIPARARRLLETPASQVVEGERSGRLWELECLLAEVGLDADQIHDLVWDTPWNKWRELGSGNRRLGEDIRKAIRYVQAKRSNGRSAATVEERAKAVRRRNTSLVGEEEVSDGRGEETPSVDDDEADEPGLNLPFVGYSRFMGANFTQPRWLIENIWAAESHGFIAGDPKSSKSTLAMAMGLSVASGKPFLGCYDVATQGPVLLVQEENPQWDVQDKLRKLSRYYGLIGEQDVERSPAQAGSLGQEIVRLAFPEDAPLHLLNNFGFDLSVEEHRSALEESVAAIQPLMLILDPLYLMLGDADENSSSQVRPFLKWLKELRYAYHCAVVVIHHFTKPQVDRGNGAGVGRRHGHRLMGSGALYAWLDSALYCEALEPEGSWNRCVRVAREFRSLAPARAVDVRMKIGSPGDLVFKAKVDEWTLAGKIEEMAREEPGILLSAVAETLGLDKRTVQKHAVGSGLVRLEGGKQGRGMSYKIFVADSESDDREE